MHSTLQADYVAEYVHDWCNRNQRFCHFVYRSKQHNYIRLWLARVYSVSAVLSAVLYKLRWMNASATHTLKHKESQASPACPSDKSSVKIKMSMEHWWNDTDKRKRMCLKKNLSQCHCVHHKSDQLAQNRIRATAAKDSSRASQSLAFVTERGN